MIISEKHLRKLIRNMIIENNEDNQNPTSFDGIYRQVVDDYSNEESEDNTDSELNNNVDDINMLYRPTNYNLLRKLRRQNQNNQ